MAGRRAQPPRAIAVTSLAQTGDPQTDRVMWQAEQSIQALEDKVRSLESRVAALEAAP